MKKTVLVLMIAVVMLMAMATAAFATQGDSTYLPAGGGNPHGGYQVNTKKCGVCHAVHHAGEAGDGLGSEALLRSTRADACTYCHISPGVSTKIVYAGATAKYDTGDLNTAHNADAGATCTGCHQVHAAASAMTSNAALTVKILKNIPIASAPATRPYSGETSARVAPTAADNTETALAKWCSECHAYYMTAKDNASHVMTTTGGSVSFVSSVYCKSCHNSNTISGVASASAFPHYTDGVRFLTSSASSLVAGVPATDSAQDGVCLRCHRDGVSDGVGMDF